MNAERSARRGGFTLVELMIATLIFSMVAAGLAAIYSSAFQQSGRTLRESRYKGMAAMALKHATRRIGAATRILEPATGGSGSVVRGCMNVAPDGVHMPDQFGNPIVPVTAFAFCVQPGTLGICSASYNATPPCLVYYEWTGNNTSTCNNMTSVSSSNCGNLTITSDGVSASAEMLASDIQSASPYFSRAIGNQIGVTMTVGRAATDNAPAISYEVITNVSGQFDARL